LTALIAVLLIAFMAPARIFALAPLFGAADDDPDENVYLVWKESDFKTDEDYVLKEHGSEYTYSFEVTADTRLLAYYIEYEETKYYPNDDGAVELEKGTYKIYFNPDYAYTTEYGSRNTKVEEIKRYYLMCPDNFYLENDYYALELDESNTDFDEYEFTVNFTQPTTYVYYIEDVVDDVRYYSNAEHYEEITAAGNYVISFAPPPQTPYPGGFYTQITKADDEIYYLLYRGNDFKLNAYYILEVDEDSPAPFDEYIFEISFFEETDFAYYVYASKEGTRYYPNADGFIRIDDEGDYDIKFSPENVYYTDAGGNDYYTTVVEDEDYYPDADYYLMSAANGYTADPSSQLSLNEDNTRFDEYTLSLTVTAPVKYVYYIYELETDGDESAHYYPNKTGVIRLKSAGEYVVKFSREHTYLTEDGVGYFTTIQKVGENPVYYLMCAQNDFKTNGDFVLQLDAENDAFDEYICHFDTDKTDTYFAYYILDFVSGGKHYPNKDGVVYLSQIDSYTVRFSPANSYYEDEDDDDKEYFTRVDLKEQAYGGYYILGNFNGYRYQNTAEFRGDYGLTPIPIGDSQEGYDYKIEFDVTADMIDEYETVQYFISDGETRYRGANDKNFVISEPGEYAIYFAEAEGDDAATVYHYAVKKYDAIDAVTELVFLDEDDNYVYIEAPGLTSDMKAKVVTRGKYSYIEIERNGESVKFDDVKVTYYIGKNADKYAVSLYAAKTLTQTDAEYSGQFISFRLSDGTGFVIAEKDTGLSAIVLSIIISVAALVVLITVISVVGGIKKKRRKKGAA
jgi:hypothetical protein